MKENRQYRLLEMASGGPGDVVTQEPARGEVSTPVRAALNTERQDNGDGSQQVQPPQAAGDVAEILRQQLADMALQYEKEREQLLQRLSQAEQQTVKVTMPMQHRLKVFTGVAPTGGNEVDFDAWEEQAEVFLTDPDISTRDPRLFASLRGIAAETIKDCRTNVEAINLLRQVFGALKDAEELMLAFSALAISKGETPAAFLGRLYGDLIKIDKVAKLGGKELKRKLYRTFYAGIQQQHPMLTSELRSRYGYPGTAKPCFSDLLHTVRQAGGTDSVRKVHQQVHQTEATPMDMSEAFIQRVVDGVVKRLDKRVETNHASRSPATQSQPGDFQGTCYRCGLAGHRVRECPNPPNPQLVAANRKKRLNAGGHLRRGNQE